MVNAPEGLNLNLAILRKVIWFAKNVFHHVLSNFIMDSELSAQKKIIQNIA